MKNLINFVALVFLLLTIILHSCKKEELPTLSTSTISNITATSASSGGNISSDGNADVTARGVCWSVNANPTTSDSKTSDGQGMGQFVSNISGLAAGLTYHIRAYATNSVGIAYGADLSFVTLGKSPECITQPATNISATGVTFNGTVNANYLSTTVTFEYGTTTSYGLTVTASQSPVTGNSITNVNAVITGLSGGTIYHFRIKAISFLDTAYGDDMTFATPIDLPTLTTTIVSGITHSSAKSGGDITNDGGGAIIARGVCWGTNANPQVTGEHTIDGTGTGSFISKMNCLSYGTIYYVRAYATNSAGTAYGNQQSFPTDISLIVFNPNLTYGSVLDIDENCYKTIQIGNQTWMAENLKTTKYNDGNPIPNVTGNIEWGGLSMPAYCWYNNDPVNKDIYGALYNWFVVNTGKLCPTGWHVPGLNELNILCHPYLSPVDPDLIVGYELMEIGTNHWKEGLGINETGFTAIPSGGRYMGTFIGLGGGSSYWSSSDGDPYPDGVAYYHSIPFHRPTSPGMTLENWTTGLSVRCMMDKDYSLCSVSTIEVSNISRNTATSGGSFTCDEGVPGGSYGVCWSTSENPTIEDRHTVDGTITDTFSSIITELSLSTKYYVRAYVVNSIGTAYGNQVSFTTLSAEPIVFNPALTYGTATDVEGNVYKTIQIGTQVWMAENLKTKKYNDNTPIPNITDNSTWPTLSTGAYCWYFNDEATFKPVYGALYNWYATNNGKLCPTGWHIPSNEEWHSLVLNLDANAQNTLGSESSIAGGKLKETGTMHWQSPNNGATNETGFTSIPGGLRNSVGEYEQVQIDGYAFYWSATELNSTSGYARMIGYDASNIYLKSGYKANGNSVRCIKD